MTRRIARSDALRFVVWTSLVMVAALLHRSPRRWPACGSFLSEWMETLARVPNNTQPGDSLSRVAPRVSLHDWAVRFTREDARLAEGFAYVFTTQAVERASTVRAQTTPPASSIHAAHAAPNFRTESLTPGVHVVSPAAPLGFGMDADSLVVVGTADVRVVEAQCSASSTEQFIAAVRVISRSPVRRMLNPHWHDDHVSANSALHLRYPSVACIFSRAMREDMRTVGAQTRSEFATSVGGTNGFVRAMIARKTGSVGAPILAAIRQQLQGLRVRGDSLGAIQTAVSHTPCWQLFAGADRVRTALLVNYVLQSAIPKAWQDGLVADRAGRLR